MIEINYLAAVIATVVSIIIAMIWYSPMMFMQSWMKEIGMTKKQADEAKNKGMGLTMILNAISTFLMACVLTLFLGLIGATTLKTALSYTFLMWFGFVGTSMLGRYFWEGSSLKLFFINGIYYLISMLAMTVIIVMM